MSLKLLDLVNRPNCLLDGARHGLTAHDVEVLSIIGSRLRARFEDSWRVGTWRRIEAKHGADGMWRVIEDGRCLAEFHPLTDRALTDALEDQDHGHWRKLRGRKIAEMTADYLKESRVALPEWPAHLLEQQALSVAAWRLVDQWHQQWNKLQTARGRRCASSDCGIPGGRFFVARTSDKDCPYCRRSVSKATRWRRRKAQNGQVSGTP